MEQQPTTKPILQPIEDDDVERVAAFLQAELNPRVPVAAWAVLMRPPWPHRGPNRGFQLVVGDAIVGAYVAIYSTSRGGRDVCNLAAFCVLDEHRGHSLRLLRAIIGQPGFVFTDLSPSGSVPALNERLGFQHLDTATRLVLNKPSSARRNARIFERPGDVLAVLQGEDAWMYEDHRRTPAARHLVVQAAEGHAYLMYRRVRRKRLGIFAAPIFVGGDPAVLRDAWPQVASLLLRHGLPVTLAEERVLGFTPPGIGWELAHPRPRMFRGREVEASEIDYLYSELALLDW